MLRHIRHSLVPLLVVIGCGGGPKPHDTSVAEHERIARKHQSAAESVEAQCAKARANELSAPIDREPAAIERLDRPGEPCWKARDKRIVDAHRDAAAQHRAASAELRAAEASACAGFSEDQRAMSPFEHPDDIASVEPLVQQTFGGKVASYQRRVGAVVTFRAVPGLTAEWLQREVDCHLARNAALGHVVPEMPDCPLVPRGVEARVRSTGNGFAVEIKSDDPDTAQEILERAERLVASSTTSASR